MHLNSKKIISCFIVLFICPLFVSASEIDKNYVNYYGIEMTNEELIYNIHEWEREWNLSHGFRNF